MGERKLWSRPMVSTIFWSRGCVGKISARRTHWHPPFFRGAKVWTFFSISKGVSNSERGTATTTATRRRRRRRRRQAQPHAGESRASHTTPRLSTPGRGASVPTHSRQFPSRAVPGPRLRRAHAPHAGCVRVKTMQRDIGGTRRRSRFF